MRGDPYLARLSLGPRRPKVKIRGRDFAGRVEAVGRDVTRFRPGDEVFGEADGAFAEYTCATEGVVGAKPANLTFQQAAAMPLAGNTALQALRDAGRVRQGQQVLVKRCLGRSRHVRRTDRQVPRRGGDRRVQDFPRTDGATTSCWTSWGTVR
jgi:threonine dehydrogenase-like Zn-dependent dehydrogenase